jgi:predicted phosphodiesterase
MRIIHTADWQIGMKAAHVGARAQDVREVRFETAEAVVEIARRRGADAIVVAGDTFEDNEVSGSDVQRVADILYRFGGPVYLIPGNHDPFVPASVWHHPAWNRESLHVLASPEPLPLGNGVTIYPCPARQKYSTADPTSWIAEAGGDGVRLGIAHGTVLGVRLEDECYPIARDAAHRTGLDFLALGHWHSTANFDGDLQNSRMAYCGTPEPTRFGERDSGNVLLIELGERGSLPQVETIATGRLRWLNFDRTIGAEVDVESILRAVEDVEQPGLTLLNLRLRGMLRPRDVAGLQRLRELVVARFPLCAHFDDRGLYAAPEDETWIAALPAGVLQNAARKVLEDRNADKSASALALENLYRFVHKESALGKIA